MPTYVYRCQHCETLQEAVQKITADPLTTCDSCGGSLRRVVQPVGIVFKGSGFYVTDYKRAESSTSSKPAESGSNGKSAEASSSKSETTESKPAANKTEKTETVKPVAAAS